MPNRVTLVIGCLLTLPMLGCLGRSQPSKIDYPVHVLTDPPGAKIEVNNDYVGDAPLTITMTGHEDREALRIYFVRAYPKTDSGGWTQVKMIIGYDAVWKGKSDRIPERLYFNTLLRPGPDVDVQLKTSP